MSFQNQTDTIIELFKLSISAHNVQPYRLKVIGENVYEVWADVQRLLKVADPHNRDLQIGLGALLETLDIGLSKSKLKLNNLIVEDASTYQSKTDFKLASFGLALDNSLEVDVLHEVLAKRFSYRGKFQDRIAVESIITCNKNIKLKLLSDSSQMNIIATIYDNINLKFLGSDGYIKELYSWLRFDRSKNDYLKDGLNTEAMGLNAIDSFGASVVLKPNVFHFLKKLNIVSLLITEKPIIKSSSAIVAIVGTSNSPLEIGRGFMRGWLELTSHQLYGAPLSLLTDDPEAMKEMKSLFEISDKENIYNILRVGPLHKEYQIPARARLNKKEYYV